MPVIDERVSVSVCKILFATDFSVAAEKAATNARSVARRCGSRVELAHVLDPASLENYGEAVVGVVISDRREDAKEILATLTREFQAAGVEAEAKSLEGHFSAKLLLGLAKEEAIDLIVAGTEAKSGLEHLVLGSTAEQLLRAATCRVLTVGPKVAPAANAPFHPQRILYATDLAPDSADSAVFALSFAQEHGSPLYPCHVVDDLLASPDQRRHQFHAFQARLKHLVPQASYDWCTPQFVVAEGEVAEEILKLAAGLNADLIVVGAHRRSDWRSHLERGVVPSLLVNATCPVLSVCSRQQTLRFFPPYPVHALLHVRHTRWPQ